LKVYFDCPNRFTALSGHFLVTLWAVLRHFKSNTIANSQFWFNLIVPLFAEQFQSSYSAIPAGSQVLLQTDRLQIVFEQFYIIKHLYLLFLFASFNQFQNLPPQENKSSKKKQTE